ncbi:MAG: methylated-DNA--[protein]-cysteine S-methyltransferase [Lentisphaeria bacterium]|nr:methylated-DNA--[protein]-cysteine S-methyltransferase [Lentisphaeria bacterium]
MKYSLSVDTPIGKITLTSDGRAVTGVTLSGGIPAEKLPERRTALLEKAAGQLLEYFRGERKTFDLPLDPAGTAFQRKVWRELERIPFGTVATYGEIAARTGRPKGARAVGQANHCNPIPILIPCHRVVAAGGMLGGYGGGTALKIRLLELEGVRTLRTEKTKTRKK